MDKKHIILRTFAEKVIAHLWLLTVPRVGIVVLSSSLSNIFPKILAFFGRKAYLCIRLAALGNLKASFHCAHWHNLCIRKEES